VKSCHQEVVQPGIELRRLKPSQPLEPVVRSFVSFLLFGFVLLASVVQAQTRPQGGQWQISMSIDGGPMGAKQEQGQMCLSNDALYSAAEKTLLDAAIQSTHRGRSPLSCEFQDLTRDASSSSWTSICKGGIGEMKGSGYGTIHAEAATIHQRLIAKSPFGTFTLNQTVNARRVGNCP
jgi:hypothetical protein